MTLKTSVLPSTFVWRRLHSLTGLLLVLFLFFHLLTNSQAALPVGDAGLGYIKAVNSIRELPYLYAIEILLLAIPFAIHIVWGIQYLRTGVYNSIPTDGTTPSLPEYSRNHAYTWQRITSWILLVLITFHVIQMRFLEAPVLQQGSEPIYMVQLQDDSGLNSFAAHMEVTLQRQKEGKIIAYAKSFGAAELLMVRETFKDPGMVLLYTVLVLSACFHAFNGLWTFLITWGVTISPASQRRMKMVALGLMALVAFMGLAAVWGTYWIREV